MYVELLLDSRFHVSQKVIIFILKGECCICMTEPAHIGLDCGHVSVCKDCEGRITQCPICTHEIVGTIEIPVVDACKCLHVGRNIFICGLFIVFLRNMPKSSKLKCGVYH